MTLIGFELKTDRLEVMPSFHIDYVYLGVHTIYIVFLVTDYHVSSEGSSVVVVVLRSRTEIEITYLT